MPSIYRNYEEIAGRVESIDGLLQHGQEKFLFELVRQLPDDAAIVEIGSFLGRSTVTMGLACKGTNRKIYSIDTWNGNDVDFPVQDFYLNWAKNIIDNQLEGYVMPLIGNSYVILNLWNTIARDKKMDLIFIDGSHVYRDVLADFYYSFEHVKDGGWVLFHDITTDGWPDPEMVWQEVASKLLVNHRFQTTLGGGRKQGPMPRWAEIYCKKMLPAIRN